MASRANQCDTDLIMRGYQDKLVELAKRQNIIAYLPTGAGKTLIGVELSKYYVQKNPKQKIAVITPTVPLTIQQSKVFEKALLKVKVYTGGHPIISRPAFLHDANKVQVVFFTPEMLRAALEQGFILMEDLSLLVVDECHHTVKKNPMNQVMKLYRMDKEDGKPVPRILGLTATVIRKNIAPNMIELHVTRSEQLLDSIAVGPYETFDMEQVLEFSTKALVRVIPYKTEHSDLVETLTLPVVKLQNVLITRSNLHSIITFPPTSGGVSLNKEETKESEKILRDILEDSKQYGAVGVLLMALRKLNYLQEQRPSKGTKAFVNSAIQTTLTCLILNTQAVYDNLTFAKWEEEWISPKVERVFEILGQYRKQVNTEDELCGLIFVQTRHLAYILLDILKEWVRLNPANKFLRPGIVVGAVNAAQVALGDRLTKARQTMVIERFRKKELNLLVCTSILEEGIDVPSCNLVLRMDPLISFVSMIQSLGRARRPKANYYALTEESEVEIAGDKLYDFDEVKMNLGEHILKRVTAIVNKQTLN